MSDNLPAARRREFLGGIRAVPPILLGVAW